MRHWAAAVASTVALAACGGGGGGTVPGTTVPAAPPTAAPQSLATVPMSLSFPLRKPSGSRRSPQFLSPDVGSMAVYDGATLIYVVNLSLDSTPQFTTVYAKSGTTTAAFGSCTFTNSAAICTLTITTTIGPHKFGLIAYPGSQGTQATSLIRTPLDTGTVPVFRGVISSEGELSVTLSPGTNPGQTLTMLGVASRASVAGPGIGSFNTASTFGYRLQDSTNSQIVQPGTVYDNGPVTITAAPSGIVTINPNSVATPPATLGDIFFDVTCVNASGGSVTISFNARTTPNTSYASGLAYSTGNYSAAVIATRDFTCDPSTATIPITVQGKRS
jgi:hypothetical protein